MTVYTVSSPEGEARYGQPVGETVELDLDPEQELALTAAGWIAHPTKKTAKAAEEVND